MSVESSARSTLEAYDPALQIDELVTELNGLYHACEADDYDRKHREIYEQLPPLWEEMTEHVKAERPETEWRILDFGCGTGFEAEQIIRGLSRDRISGLTCYDPSPEMLERCRSKIAPLFPEARFLSKPAELPEAGARHNMLATNSLLHHLPDPYGTIGGLVAALSKDAVWLAGHEPSSRFYQNPDCTRVHGAFLRERRWRRFLSPRRYLQEFGRLVGLRSDPAKVAAREAFRKGLFRRMPPARIVARLVDFHAAHSGEEAGAGRGFDFEVMQRRLSGAWSLSWVRTYSFMGSFYEGDLSAGWLRKCRELERIFPTDGASFCSIWCRR